MNNVTKAPKSELVGADATALDHTLDTAAPSRSTLTTVALLDQSARSSVRIPLA
jgi:hypothetical protein